ncbi:MAG: aminoglycoside phosphotransferase family protein [Clostridia bacterium]|nr:aminoglycoside phosphotransferase family protein [Clostridia bacterium]
MVEKDFEMTKKLAAIGRQFMIPGDIYAFSVIKRGNINATFKVTFKQEEETIETYIFQRINTFVFKSPVEIMENIELVTSFIEKKSIGKPSLKFRHTKDGKNYCYDDESSFWRVMNYIDSVTFDLSDDPYIIASTGEAFGQFVMLLSELDGSKLHETIPDFHNTGKRLDTLFKHEALAPDEVLDECRNELRYIHDVGHKARKLSDKFLKGKLPVRVTHNDTKCNNVLFDKDTKRPLVVIDLDTVMPGMAMYDFGDAVRFIANSCHEDEPDVRKVFFDTSKFRAFCKGYLGQVKGILTKEEIDSLVLATFSITIELAARFLDDYILGDVYFKIDYPGHNLVRTRCQLALAKDIMRKFDELTRIVEESVNM